MRLTKRAIVAMAGLLLCLSGMAQSSGGRQAKKEGRSDRYWVYSYDSAGRVVEVIGAYRGGHYYEIEKNAGHLDRLVIDGALVGRERMTAYQPELRVIMQQIRIDRGGMENGKEGAINGAGEEKEKRKR